MINLWTLKNQLYRIINPSLWIQVKRKRNQDFEKYVMKSIEEGTMTPMVSSSMDVFVAILPNDTKLWVSNYPYSFGRLVDHEDEVATLAIGETKLKVVKQYIDDKIEKKEFVTTTQYAAWSLSDKSTSFLEFAKNNSHQDLMARYLDMK